MYARFSRIQRYERQGIRWHYKFRPKHLPTDSIDLKIILTSLFNRLINSQLSGAAHPAGCRHLEETARDESRRKSGAYFHDCRRARRLRFVFRRASECVQMPSASINGVSQPRSVMAQNTSQVTHLLSAIEEGNEGAADRLLDLVYSELRKIATQKVAAERPGQTLVPTALVHEAWLRLNCGQGAHFANRAHFFGAAAEAMRRILIDRARRRLAAKRGFGAEALDLDEVEISSPANDDDVLLRLNEALETFAALYPREAEIVKLRYFVGMTFGETATALGIAVPTAKKRWAYARAWLRVKMSQPD